MKRALTLIVVLICTSFILPFAGWSQRQTAGRPSINAQVLFGDGMRKGSVAVTGFNATWSGYQRRTYFSTGIDFQTHPYNSPVAAIYDSDGVEIAPASDYTMRCYDVQAGAGFFVRAVSTRNRVFILSVGGSLYLGARIANEMKQFVKDKNSEKKYNGVGFIMYLMPEMVAEVFPFNNVSLFLSVRPRIRLVDGTGGQYGWFKFGAGFGVKYYF